MRTASALLVALIATLALAGCVPDDDPVVLDPEPTVTPIFESDEEALAAAEEAYGAYLAASDQVSASGGVDTALLEPHATADYLEFLTPEFEEFEESGRKTTGATRFDSFELQQHAELGEQALVSIYLCLDVSDVRVLDQNNVDVTPIERQLRLPLEVTLVATSSEESLRVDSSQLWDGANFCE
jgi:hypothetical protein